MPINGPTTDNRNALVDTDFEADAFAHGPLLQPIVKVDTTQGMAGTGSAATPLEVSISTDAENSISFGTDGGIYSGDTFSQIVAQGGASNPVANISAPATYGPYATLNMVYNNPSNNKIARVLILNDCELEVSLDGGGTQVFNFRLQYQLNGGGYIFGFADGYGGVAGGLRQALTKTDIVIFSILPGASLTYDVFLEMVTSGAASGTSTLLSAINNVFMYGVAV